MKTYWIILLLLLTAGCEQINDVEIEIGHNEFIVVQGEVKNGFVFEGVSFTKTLPLGEPFDIQKAEIKNVEAFIVVNGLQVVPIHYVKDGIYKPYSNLLIRTGNTYELFAKIDGKAIYSKTKVPRRPEPRNILYQNSYLSANIMPAKDEVYGATWVIKGTTNNIISAAEDFFSITAPVNNDLSTDVSIRTQDVTQQYSNDFYRDLTYIKVYSFDKPYLEYFKSKDNNSSVSNIFTQGGGAVAWNVYGDNVIGLFIGVSESATLQPE